MTPFGVETTVAVVVAEIADGDSRGRGEGVPLGRFGESIDSVIAAIDAMKGAVFSGLNRDTLQHAMPPGVARHAIDCAFWAIDRPRLSQCRGHGRARRGEAGRDRLYARPRYAGQDG
jgi:hypothetical protein